MTDSYIPAPSPGRDQPTEQQWLELQIQHLLIAVEHELRTRPSGINELELIKTLQKPPWELLGPVNFHDPGELYPAHFLVFHALYRLRDLVARQGEAMVISPLVIRLYQSPVVAGSGPVAEQDGLREFYLDLTQYELPEESIHKMMDDFWSGRTVHKPRQEDTLSAASTLGFDTVPRDFSQVKYRFRRAVMQAHPDRGGDTKTIQSLNEAFSILKAHFGN